MAILFYGDGDCSVKGEGTEIRGVQIEYTGYITDLVKNTSSNFKLMGNNIKIIIFPIGEGYLDNLFSYKGSLKVTSCLAVDGSGEGIHCNVEKLLDYSELILTNAEDMTTKSEDLKSDYFSGKKISNKNSNSSPIIENFDTEGRYFLADGSVYKGLAHVHLIDSAVMTGGTHTEDSQDLYFKQSIDLKLIDKLVPTRNPSHMLPGNRLRRNQKRKRKRGV